jgi:phosphatidylserine decarboxylase
MIHQYIERPSGRIREEKLIADPWVQWLYGYARERTPLVFKALTSARATRWLSLLNYDLPIYRQPARLRKLIQELNIDLRECLEDPAQLDSARKLFERRITYWRCRPMPEDPGVVVAPADAKALVGSWRQLRQLFLKEKFFSFQELLGRRQTRWHQAFKDGDFAVFRLTPEKYHHNHLPVAGRVVDFYAIDGDYHSCNPAAVVVEATPFSKNKRVVTIIDTDLPGGTQIGLVAMVEVVALMIGEIVQCYSARRYDAPQPIRPGMFVLKGQPKSLYRPGSSVDLLFFQPGRMAFDADLLANSRRADVQSRFTQAFQHPLVETEVQARSSIGRRRYGRKL